MPVGAYTPVVGARWGNNADCQGFEIRRARLYQLGAGESLAAVFGAEPPDGAVAYRGVAGLRRIEFYDDALNANVLVPRLDYNEQVSGLWAFNYNPGAASSFTVASIVRVDNLNAHYVADANNSNTGRAGSSAATASTVVIRDSNARILAGDPSGAANSEVVTYGFMYSFIQGVRDPKQAVLAVYPSVLPAFSFAANNITASANGAINPVDGQTLAVNDRIGIVLETGGTAKYNGIYTVSQVGDAGTPFILSRSSDADTDAEVTNGLQFWATTGTTYGSSGWLLTTPDPITLNTTALTFVQNNGTAGITAGNGVVKVGNTIHAIRSSNYDQGGIVYATSTTALSMAQLTGIVKGNGTSAPTAVLPGTTAGVTSGKVAKFSSGTPYLIDSLITDDGSTVTVGGAFVVTGATTLATTLTGMLKGSSGVISAVTGATNRVTFWSDANTLSSNAGFTYDGTTLVLDADLTFTGTQTISTTTGALNLVTGAANANVAIAPHGTGITTMLTATNASAGARITNSSTGTAAAAAMVFVNNAGGIISYIGLAGSNRDTYINLAPNVTAIYTDNAAGIALFVDANGPISFATNSAVQWTILGTGTLQSTGAKTIGTTTGVLTLVTGAANANVAIAPHGTGITTMTTATDGGAGAKITNTSAGTSASALMVFVNNAASVDAFVGLAGSNRATYVNWVANALITYTTSAAGIAFLVDANGPITFATNSVTRWSILGTGVMQSTGAQTITTTTGALSLTTGAANGAISHAPHGTGPVTFTSGVTTGTGTTAAMSLVANSLTTGMGFSAATSSLTTGSLFKLEVTGTAADDGQAVLNVQNSGATAANAKTTYAGYFMNARTNATSGTNVGILAWALGATTANYAIYIPAGTIAMAGSSSGLVQMTVAAAAGTWTMTLPTSGGTANYALITNGSGVSSWAILPVAGGGTGRTALYVSSVIGDGVNSSFSVTHSFGHRNVHVSVYDTASPYQRLEGLVVTLTSTNAITVDFGFIPTSNQFTVVVT